MFLAGLPNNVSEAVAGPSHHAPRAPRSTALWAAINKVNQALLVIQVSHHGRYSIERLIALDEYVRSTSWARVIIVCLITPLPVIVLVLFQESVPLHDPAEGWRVNYGIWIRTAVVSGAVSHSVITQFRHMVDAVAMSKRQLAVIVAIIMLGYTGMCVVVAANVVFPIPFMSITMALPFLLIIGCAFYFVMGGQAIRQIFQHKEQLFRFIGLLTSQILMIVIYPAYQVLFQAAADNGYELLAFALLPILKTVMKNVASLSFYGMQDLMPEGVIFTVDFFNAFYMATSMQNASSPTTVIVIMAVDLITNVQALNGLRKGFSSMLQKVETLPSDGPREFDLIHTASLICQSYDKLELQNCTGIQLRSCFPYQLSVAGKHLLDHLSKHPELQARPTSIFCKSGQDTVHKASKKRRWRCRSGQSAVVYPKRDEITRSFQRSELRDALDLLFTSECHVLSEYLESVVPVLYASYIVVMVHLPSARYHLEMAGITNDNVEGKVRAVFVYALLEFLSFLMMAVVVQRKCGMKILHHLAFVLEYHVWLIQDKLIAWTLLTLVSRVVHFGTWSDECQYYCD